MTTIKERIKQLEMENSDIYIKEFKEEHTTLKTAIEEIATKKSSDNYTDIMYWLNNDTRALMYMNHVIYDNLLDMDNYNIYTHARKAMYLQLKEEMEECKEEIKEYMLYKYLDNKGYGDIDADDCYCYIDYIGDFLSSAKHAGDQFIMDIK